MESPATPSRSPRTDDGLTLVEMVVAMGVLMVVMIASLSVFMTVQHSQRVAEGTDRAIQLANHRIERIRQQDWRDIGFYQNTYTSKTTAPTKTDTATTNADYTTYLPAGETLPASRVILGPSEQNVGSDIVTPYEVTTSERNKYTIYTTITWGVHPTLGAPVESGSTTAANELYTFKRVRVTVTWRSGGTGALHKVVNETWFAPNAHEEAPPGVPVNPEP